jgi:hypothetical protein
MNTKPLNKQNKLAELFHPEKNVLLTNKEPKMITPKPNYMPTYQIELPNYTQTTRKAIVYTML